MICALGSSVVKRLASVFSEPYAIRAAGGSVEARELQHLQGVRRVAKTHCRRRNMRPVLDHAPAEVPAGTLTAVEREVAGLIADGLTNQAIAKRLGLARLTVSQHVATVLWRLGLRARHEIAAWAIAQDRHASGH